MGGSILLGILNGLDIGVIALGIVLIFKTSKCINFAQAQLGILPMLFLGRMVIIWGINWYAAVIVALIGGLVIGLAAERVTVRLFAAAGSQFVLVASIGVSQVLLGIAYIRSLGAPETKLIESGFPVPFHVSFTISGQTFFAQHVLTLIVVPTVTLLLFLTLRFTLTGKAIRAAASNNEAALLSGLDANRLSAIAWAAAGVLSTIGALLTAPNNPNFDPSEFGPDLMFRALGAAALAGFSSFPQALAAALGLSVVEEGVIHVTSNATDGQLAVFLVIVVGLLLRRTSRTLIEGADFLGRGTSLRPGIPAAISDLALARVARIVVAAVCFLAGLAIFVALGRNSAELYNIEEALVFCGAALSVSLLAGLTGQFSLGQFALVGLGGEVAARLLFEGSTQLVVNLLVVAVVGMVVAALVGLPALRSASITTAVTTLGFGVVGASFLLNLSIFQKFLALFRTARPRLRGFGLSSPKFFGAVINEGRAQFVFVAVVLALLVVGGCAVNRSGLGTQLRAVRFSVRGSMAMGIRPGLTLLVGVAIAGVIASMTGLVDSVANQGFGGGGDAAAISLVLFSIAVIGGLGSPTGAVIAALLIYGIPMLCQSLLERISLQPSELQLLLSGAGLILNLGFNPGGIAALGGQLLSKLAGPGPPDRPTAGMPEPVVPTSALGGPAVRTADVRRPRPTVLAARDVSVFFGQIRALSDVSISVRDGEIVGLIGNNGAGKTTLLNCVAGTHHAASGTIELFGQDLTRASVVHRARLGLGRTFQDAGLFPGLTTEEIFELAERRRTRAGAGGARTVSRVPAVMAQLGLTPYRKSLAGQVPTGVRRLVELGVQLLRQPRLLLLDEPTAGLSQAEAEQFGTLLRRVSSALECAVLMIEHDLPLMLSLADRMYCLELGTVIAEGPPAEMRKNQRVIESYFGSPGGVGARRSGAMTDRVWRP